MSALAQAHAPRLMLDVAGIEHARQNPRDLVPAPWPSDIPGGIRGNAGPRPESETARKRIRLRAKLALYGATRECLNFKFEDTPEGKFIETVIAAQGELEREQNGRQVVQKMKARLERGYWVFQAPVGYRYGKGEGGGRALVRDEPLASIIREALEGYPRRPAPASPAPRRSGGARTERERPWAPY